MAVNCKFTAVCPTKFQMILERDQITMAQLIESFDLVNNRNRVFEAGEGAGRSGSFFFTTHDTRFMIKTMRGPEKKEFLKMIDSYISHLIENPDSLITRIYGIFTIKTSYFDPVDIMVMQHTARL